MNHLSLFSGIGGIDLAAHWARFNTIAFVEKDKYCQQVLAKHWPGVPIYDDIKTCTAKSLGIEPGTITLISGGYPCQPESLAGKRRGKDDDRWLWPEMLRLIKELRPRWVVGENVAGHTTMGLDSVLLDLENCGYSARAIVVPACAVNAPHRRNRVFILAHPERTEWWSPSEGYKPNWENARRPKTSGGFIESRQNGGSQNVADSQSGGRRQDESEVSGRQLDVNRGSEIITNPERQGLAFGERERRERAFTPIAGSDWWAVEPGMGRVANGIPARVDRLRGLGNAVVPQQIYPILKAIADYENQKEKINV